LKDKSDKSLQFEIGTITKIEVQEKPKATSISVEIEKEKFQNDS
jgi:hypothetical protein